jgi:hypothetical protein
MEFLWKPLTLIDRLGLKKKIKEEEKIPRVHLLLFGLVVVLHHTHSVRFGHYSQLYVERAYRVSSPPFRLDGTNVKSFNHQNGETTSCCTD